MNCLLVPSRPFALLALAGVLMFGHGLLVDARAQGMPTLAPAPPAEDAQEESPPAGGAVAYTVRIEGAPAGAVESLIEDSSLLLRLRNNPPMTIAALGQRITRDERRFRAVLESEGYYSATVATSAKQETDRVAVVVSINPGALYRVGSVVFDIAHEDPETAAFVKPEDYAAPLREIAGRPARAADVIRAEDASLDIFRSKGFPFARRGDRQVDVDHSARTIAVRLPVVPGRQAVFGATRFSGLERVNEAHLRRLVPWPEGATFSLDQLDKFREELILASLFTSVRVEPAATGVPGNGAPLDVDVIVAEGPHRSIGAGATYARDKGPGGSVFWHHRNLFGNGERFEATVDGSRLGQIAEASIAKPGFLDRHNTLELGATVRHEDTDAFREYGGAVRAGIARELESRWRVTAGTTFEYAALTEDGVKRNSYLAGLPLGISRAFEQRLLVEMTRGARLRVSAIPYVGRYSRTTTFVHLESEVDGYMPVVRGDRLVLAGRLKLGSLVGESADDIPANKRFYAGGGGSIRGYGYQLVGPLDAENEPMGGRGLIEASAEARFRLSDTIGVVPFADAGIVSRHGLPGQDGKIRVGAGIGLRYYTGAGPLRVDFAAPLNRRAGLDRSFQFYISFGQAF